MKTDDTEACLAVKISAEIMVAAGLCRFEDPENCRKSGNYRENCAECIREWLISKARQELNQEKKKRRQRCNADGGVV